MGELLMAAEAVLTMVSALGRTKLYDKLARVETGNY